METILIKNGAGDSKYMEVTGTGTVTDPYRYIVRVSDYDNGKTPFYQLMDTVGDRSGDVNMNVDGSTTPITFYIKPKAGEVIKLARIITSLRDGGSFDSGGWGNQTAELTNGLELKWKRDGVLYNLTEVPIKSHYDLASYSYDIDHSNFGSGDEFLTNRFTFTKAGQYLTLDGDLGDELQVIVNDDLTYLVDQRVSAQGYYE